MNLFLTLLHAELFNKPIDIDIQEKEYQETIQIAIQQQSIAYILHALERNKNTNHKSINFDIIRKHINITKRIKENQFVNKHLIEFTQFLKRNHQQVFFMKGPLNAICYPLPKLREVGDLDYYCPPDTYYETLSLISKKLNKNFTQQRSTKHHSFTHCNMHYEQHYFLTDFLLPSHHRLWEKAVAEDIRKPYYVKIENTNIPTFSPTLTAAYLFFHLFFHLITTGISIRQFSDWAMHLHHYRTEIDARRLSSLLKECGLYNAYTHLGLILTQYIGLPIESFPLPLPQSKRAQKRAKKYIQNILQKKETGYSNKVYPEGIRHSLQTGYITLRQSLLYAPIAPIESGLRVFAMGYWSIKGWIKSSNPIKKINK